MILYNTIYEQICSKTKILIEEEKWEELEKLYRISPNQLSLFSDEIEENLKTSQLIKESPLVKREYETETNIEYYSYNLVFWLTLEVLKRDRSFFTQDFKNDVCSIIFSFMKENQVNSAACKDFTEGLHDEIKEMYQAELVNIPNLLVHMIEKEPDIGIRLYDKIVEKEFYEIGFNILIKHPDLIETHLNEVKKLFQNVILNKLQYNTFTHPLIELHPELKLVIDEHRIKLKYDFYNKLLYSESNGVYHDWFEKNHRIFSFCLDLYEEDELDKIVKRLMGLNVEYSYDSRESYWINLCLLEIGWLRKRDFFHDYISDLTELKYQQVVRDYYFQYPEKIKDNQDQILKIQYFSLDLLEKKLDYFQIDDPVALFKEFLTSQYNILVLKKVFYQQYKELIHKLNETIKNYLNQIDVSNLNTNQKSNISYVHYIFEILCGHYSIYIPDFEIGYFQDILTKILSVDWIAEIFNPISSLYIPRNFEKFELGFQKKIIDLLIENNRLYCIETFLQINFLAFEPHIDRILEYIPQEPHEAIHFVKVISIVLKSSFGNLEVTQKAKRILQDLNPSPEKVQLYTFLGDLNLSKEILDELLDREQALPYAINLILDLNSILFEISIKNNESIDYNAYIDEIANLKTQIESYSSDTTTLQNFTFKQTNLNARLFLYQGFLELQNENEIKSIEFFRKARDLLQQLKSTKVIKKTTKVILEAYYNISSFFHDNVANIINKLNQGVEIANHFLEESLNSLFEQFDQSNIQNSRIIGELQNLRFDVSTKNLYQINYEIPTKFCPKPPLITKRSLYKINNELVQEWNENNDPIIDDPTCLSFGSNQLTLEIEFREKEKYYDFILEIKRDANLDTSPPQINTESGKVSFNFNLKSSGFDGIQNLTFELIENDLCGFNLNLCMDIIHESYASLEQEIINELVKSMPNFKNRTVKHSDYLIFLNQFEDPAIRSGVLKHILKRLPEYYLTLRELIKELKNEIQRLHYDDGGDELIICILNQLELKSPDFCQYLVRNYIDYGRYVIKVKKSKELLEDLVENPPLKNTHIIFLDDTIGRGNQFVGFYEEDFKQIYENSSLKENQFLKFYLIASKGSYESIEYISQNSIIEESDIHYCKILRDSDKAFYPEVWQDDQLLEKVKDFLREKDDNFWDGHKAEGQTKGLEYLIVNEWTVPKNTIGCLWNRKGNWRPIFPRA